MAGASGRVLTGPTLGAVIDLRPGQRAWIADDIAVDQIAETNSKARGIDAKNYVTDKYLKRLDEEGFVKKIWGK